MTKFVDIFKELELVSTTAVDLTGWLPLSKLQTRVPTDVTIENDLYTRYINSAIKIVETMAEISIVEKEYNLHLQTWPGNYDQVCGIRLETLPVTEIGYVKYYDSDDDQQTLDSTKYEQWLSHQPPMILIRRCNVPILSGERMKRIEVNFTAGLDNLSDISSQFPTAELAIIELVAFWYQNRESEGRIPDGVQGKVFQNLIDSLRWRAYP